MTNGQSRCQGQPGQTGRQGSSETTSALSRILHDWEADLSNAIPREAVRQVGVFLKELERRRQVDGGLRRFWAKDIEDAVLAFAFYWLNRPQEGASAGVEAGTERAGAGAGPKSPVVGGPTTPSGPAGAAASLRLAWQNRIERLSRANFAKLLELLAAASANDATKQQAETLQALLVVYFEMDWSGSAEAMVDLAYRAGELLCRLIMASSEPEPAKNTLLHRGCELLNDHEQFKAQFKCETLTPRAAYDRQRCEEPTGQRQAGGNVRPLSFYIVNNTTGALRRRAKVEWI